MCGTHLIYYSVLCFVHKINFEMMPSAIVNLLVFNDNKSSRFVKAPVKHLYKSNLSITSNSLLYKGIFLYSKIDEILYYMSSK